MYLQKDRDHPHGFRTQDALLLRADIELGRMAGSVSPCQSPTLNTGTGCAKSRRIGGREAKSGARTPRSRLPVPPPRPGAASGHVRKTLRHSAVGREGCGSVGVAPSVPERGPVVVNWWRKRYRDQKTLRSGTRVRDLRLEWRSILGSESSLSRPAGPGGNRLPLCYALGGGGGVPNLVGL